MALMLRFLKPHWKLCTLTVALLILDVAGALFIPTMAAHLLNQGVNAASFDAMLTTGIAMAVASAVSGVGAILGGYCCARLSAGLGKDMRVALYNKSLKLSTYDFRSFGTASITTRTINDIVNIQFALISAIQMLLPVPIIFAIAISLAFSLDTQMALVLVGGIAFVLVAALFIMRSASPLFRRLQKLLDRMSAVLLENLTGVRVIRAFNKEHIENERLDGAFGEYATTSIKANRLFANLDGLSFLAVNMVIVVFYWMAGGRISTGGFQIGNITAMVEYAMMALFYLGMAQMVIIMLPRALECCNRVREVLDYEPQISDPVAAQSVAAQSDAAQHDATQTHTTEHDATQPLNPSPQASECSDAVMEFNEVTFRFADAQEDALHQMNFTCHRGRTTAVIGGTGSGKSTIAALALRFHDATWGSVRFQGTDVKQWKQHDLRSHIAYVQQRAWLFSGTIAENLRYGDASASDEWLWHALEVAQAADFVRALPQGLESAVAQGGTNFSGGQRQRLAIARALAKRPDLYIFDDSFSALDFKTDAALRRALSAETGDAALLVVGQRVSSIRDSDEIIVLSDGGIAGTGTHEELMATCPVYQEIVASQTKEDDDHE
jgi:ATP-binding cassette subfamily B protein